MSHFPVVAAQTTISISVHVNIEVFKYLNHILERWCHHLQTPPPPGLCHWSPLIPPLLPFKTHQESLSFIWSFICLPTHHQTLCVFSASRLLTCFTFWLSERVTESFAPLMDSILCSESCKCRRTGPKWQRFSSVRAGETYSISQTKRKILFLCLSFDISNLSFYFMTWAEKQGHLLSVRTQICWCLCYNVVLQDVWDVTNIHTMQYVYSVDIKSVLPGCKSMFNLLDLKLTHNWHDFLYVTWKWVNQINLQIRLSQFSRKEGWNKVFSKAANIKCKTLSLKFTIL